MRRRLSDCVNIACLPEEILSSWRDMQRTERGTPKVKPTRILVAKGTIRPRSKAYEHWLLLISHQTGTLIKTLPAQTIELIPCMRLAAKSHAHKLIRLMLPAFNIKNFSIKLFRKENKHTLMWEGREHNSKGMRKKETTGNSIWFMAMNTLSEENWMLGTVNFPHPHVPAF